MNTYTTEWTGAYPNLCSGEWTLFKNGEKVDVEIPFQGCPANTAGEYEEWWFENWNEVFGSYFDGLSCEEWCKENKDYLVKVAPAHEWANIYCAFSENDWRHGSCGGCI